MSDSKALMKTDQQIQGTLALLVSLVGHLFFFLLLACWVFLPGMPQEGLTLRYEQSDSDKMTLVETTSSIESWEQVASTSSAISIPSQPVVLDVESLQLLPESLDNSQADMDSLASLASFSARDMSQALSDSEARQGASFFGAYAAGSRFVYILDSSKSMDGDRWNLAKQSLLQSLKDLGPSRQFFVICFDARTTLLFDRRPEQLEFLSADGKTIQRVEKWLRSVQLGPATMPGKALELALNLQPDAIFLLSDGELHDDSLYRLRWLNVESQGRRKIPIHAIHLISQEGRYTLEQIARENGGSFTFISDRSRRRR